MWLIRGNHVAGNVQYGYGASVKRGGTALFALLAMAGDVGCSSGPTYVGMISGALNDNLKMGFFVIQKNTP